MNENGTTVSDIYVPYEDSEDFTAVPIMIVNDSDGKFTSSEAESFVTSYVGIISRNSENTSFTPSASKAASLSAGAMRQPRRK
jgi:hypothetical protein